MTDRRKQLLTKLLTANPSESEQKMVQLVIERICADMCDFYDKFYVNDGPGAIVYLPRADTEEDTMFYLPVAALMNALKDFRDRDMEGPADVMQKSIARAEALDLTKEALFIIQDAEFMSLVHYKRDTDGRAILV